jgi:predicted flap endonuclease-1-like 5' DNA nuclease
MANLIAVEGIGPVYAQKLKEAGIGSTEALLAAGATPEGRQDIAAKTGIGDSLILRWVNHVDLFRIKGVGEEYSDLLEAAGVDTVVELAQRVPANLYAKLAEVNQAEKRVRKLPAESQVKNWIKQAKKLPRKVSY